MGLLDRVRARLAPPARPAFNRLPPEAFAAFGPGSYIHEPALITNPDRIHLGAGVVIHGRCWLSVVTEHNGRTHDPVLRIGDGTVLGHDLVIACIGEVTIGARVQAADRVFIGDCYHDYRDPDTAVIDQPMSDPQPVRIADGAFLGVNAVILPGVTVGERAYVGAGAVVTRDVAANTVVAGNPARVIRRYADGEWRPP